MDFIWLSQETGHKLAWNAEEQIVFLYPPGIIYQTVINILAVRLGSLGTMFGSTVS